MLGISVELGTYSIKFLNFRIEKKQIQLLNTEEIAVDPEVTRQFDSNDNEDENSDLKRDSALWNHQLELVKNYLHEIEYDYHLFMNFPSEVVSMRFLNLPVKNKKKALMMLPFQIEEDLPYSLSTCHWAESIKEEAQHTEVTVGIVKKEQFESFFQGLVKNKITPNILTHDVSNYELLIEEHKNEFPNSFCILNLGHETTRGFYFHNGKLVSNHQSYIAGKSITETISKTYSISTEEATIYKHQNSFFLLPEQYDDVNENQREFAKVMNATFTSLISEIKRWDIGFRVQNGNAIKEIYICGGTSNIKNIANYLSAKLGVVVHTFDPFKFMNDVQIDKDDKIRKKFSQVAALTTTSPKKSKVINFLKGEYALNSSNDLPVESMAFIGVRIGILSLIISMYFIIKAVSLNLTLANTSKKHLINLYKNESIKDKISKSLIRRSANNPNLILSKLNQHNKMIEQEVKVIQSSLEQNAFNKLVKVLDYFSGHKVEIIKFVSDETDNLDLVISNTDLKALNEIKSNFEDDKKYKWFLSLNEKDKKLSIGGKIK